MSVHSSPPPTLFAAAVDSIRLSLSRLCTPTPDHRLFENPHRFSAFAHRLTHLLPSLPQAAPVQTALRGISGELSKAAEIVKVYDNGSKILVLMNCKTLCSSLHERTVAIAAWLNLLHSALQDSPDADDDLRKKVYDLSRDMKLANFRVTENEERVRCTLEKEAEEGEGRETSKAVQSGIVMDLARAFGVDPGDRAEFCKQVKLFKDDAFRSDSVFEQRVLVSLKRILSNWPVEPAILTGNWEFGSVEDDDTPILPFRNFLCPLTKEIMRDPVVLPESSQT